MLAVGIERKEPTDLQKVELDQPYYWVNVDGMRVRLDNIDYLMEQRL